MLMINFERGYIELGHRLNKPLSAVKAGPTYRRGFHGCSIIHYGFAG